MAYALLPSHRDETEKEDNKYNKYKSIQQHAFFQLYPFFSENMFCLLPFTVFLLFLHHRDSNTQ